jgi:FkbM family methyltransferase
MGLKVLQLCHDYEDPFVSVCSTYNKAFNSEEHEVWTVYLRGAESKYVRDAVGGAQVMFFDLGRRSLRGLKLLALSKVVSLCRREKFDLVVAHRYKPIYLAGLASFFTDFRLILGVAHEHDVFARVGRRMFLRYLRPRIKIAGVSNSVKQDILSKCRLPDGPDRIYCLPNCIDETSEPEILSAEEARKQLNLPPDVYIFGTIGRLVQKKEQEILLQGLLDSKLSDVRVVIIGAGPRLSQLQGIANKLGIADRIIFAGRIPQAFKYIRAFDAFVLPSGRKEAFGLVLLEAMMARVPIICSDSPGPAEVVGDTGLHFEQGNATDLAVRMNQMTDLSESDVAPGIDVAYQRLRSEYSSSAFRKRFWELAPFQNLEEKVPFNAITRLLDRSYHNTVLPLAVRHSLYRKLRRRGVTPRDEFEIDFFGLRYSGNIVNEIDANVYFYGAFEKPMLYFLRDFLALRPGAFVDVGANVGNHSLFMSLHATVVHCFEPFPPVLERLTNQVQINRLDNVYIHGVALGEKPGKVPFYPPPDKSLGGGSFVETIAEKHGKRPGIDLEVARGDDYFTANGIKDFSAIKVDVEGFEIPVLVGLKQTLARVRPLVIVEVTHSASEDVRVTTDIGKFLPNDYTLLRFENRGDRWFRQQSHSAKNSGHYRLYSLAKKVRTKRVNVVACPLEILDQLSMFNSARPK